MRKRIRRWRWQRETHWAVLEAMVDLGQKIRQEQRDGEVPVRRL